MESIEQCLRIEMGDEEESTITSDTNRDVDESSLKEPLWIFGYGSLCWNPGFQYEESLTGYIRGFSRRFWQGNTTHRGTETKGKRTRTVTRARAPRLRFAALWKFHSASLAAKVNGDTSDDVNAIEQPRSREPLPAGRWHVKERPCDSIRMTILSYGRLSHGARVDLLTDLKAHIGQYWLKAGNVGFEQDTRRLRILRHGLVDQGVFGLVKLATFVSEAGRHPFVVVVSVMRPLSVPRLALCQGITWGKAFLVSTANTAALPYLAKRECRLGGYHTCTVNFYPKPSESTTSKRLDRMPAVLYIAVPENRLWLGAAPLPEIAKQILECQGRSGSNAEYLLKLADFMRDEIPEALDEHLFSLERLVRIFASEMRVCLKSLMGHQEKDEKAEPKSPGFQFASRVPDKKLRCVNM
ncbi:Glutathione-specific gamma-glutamylcyclotransferase 1 [Eumeta japonica]|uniref:Glutathione-specific gamma-glutamylcyclotransferase 1 n=1 Tax=Eumeta variegata TaxID=151549 RepID=A0A4C1URT1_EUMVA|nr:Glutathione-specific gamma-glutamylcyclotransferase 1 [Eumeta japonica]